jgi:hypothetical protein
MFVGFAVSRRLFRHSSVLVALATGYAPSAVGINAIFLAQSETRFVKSLGNLVDITRPHRAYRT